MGVGGPMIGPLVFPPTPWLRALKHHGAQDDSAAGWSRWLPRARVSPDSCGARCVVAIAEPFRAVS